MWVKKVEVPKTYSMNENCGCTINLDTMSCKTMSRAS